MARVKHVVLDILREGNHIELRITHTYEKLYFFINLRHKYMKCEEKKIPFDGKIATLV